MADHRSMQRLQWAILVVLLLCLAGLGIVIFQNNQREWEASRAGHTSDPSPAAAVMAPDDLPGPLESFLPGETNGVSLAGQPGSEEAVHGELMPDAQADGLETRVHEYWLPVGVGVEVVEESSTNQQPVNVVEPDPGGSVYGKVFLQGAPPAEHLLPLDPLCESLQGEDGPLTTQFYRFSDDGGLADVLIYLESPELNGLFPAPEASRVLDNVGCLYTPYVLALQAGQELLLRNSDPVAHSFHFDLVKNPPLKVGALANSPDYPVVFQEPELFRQVKCDIHPWTFAYVSIVPHPFFAVTDTHGIYHLPTGLPRGTYDLVARHRRAGEYRTKVAIKDDAPVHVDAVLTVPGWAD